MAQRVLYVDPIQGNDTQEGHSTTQPLRTITAALRRLQADTLIYLRAGVYSTRSGEQFPLLLPAGCQMVGERQGDRGAVLQGSGIVQHPSLGRQAVTCRLRGRVALKDISIISTQSPGIGLWIDVGLPYLQGLVVQDCSPYGAVVLGAALPTIMNSVFDGCSQAGIAWFTQAKGQLEAVICRNNDTGILLQDGVAPFIKNCQLNHNTQGLKISGTANPVLRETQVIDNHTYGIYLTGQGTADLGDPQSPGQNTVRNNGDADINNRSSRSLISCGNDLVPQRLMGDVQLLASRLPDPSAVPGVLFDQPATVPTLPDASPFPPNLDDILSQPPGSVRFRDMANHWAGPFVDGLAAAQAVAGFTDGTFRPAQRVTRAQFAALVMASFSHRPAVQPAASFTDIPAGFWAAAALSKAQTMGFLTGYPDGTMRPNDPITRIQAIVSVTNGLGLTGGRVDDVGMYHDRAQVPSYAINALATATQRRLVVNYPDPFNVRPLEPMTRGEVAALIYQGRVIAGLSSVLASPYIVHPATIQPRFSDLVGHWAADFIQGLAAAHLVRGLQDGRFAPDRPMNRAQFAALVVQAFQPEPIRAAMGFRDVSPDFWGAAAIQGAYQGGFMTGFPDQTFGPDNPLVRVQIWIALVNGLQWDSASVDLNVLGRFADYTTIPRYALSSTAIAADRNMIASYPDPTQLHPNQVATRADVCVSVYQALAALKRLPTIPSRYLG